MNASSKPYSSSKTSFPQHHTGMIVGPLSVISSKLIIIGLAFNTSTSRSLHALINTNESKTSFFRSVYFFAHLLLPVVVSSSSCMYAEPLYILVYAAHGNG